MSPTLLSLFASVALAADVDDFAPSSSQVVGTGSLQGEMPLLPTEGAAAGVLSGFVQDPAQRIDDRGTRSDLVSAMLPVALYGGYTVEDRARIDLFLPVYAHVEAPANDFSGAAFGDVRLQAVIPFAEAGPVAIGFVPRFELPTGTRDAVTRRGVSGGGHLILGTEVEGTAGWVANLGLTGAGTDRLDTERMGSSFDSVLGAWYHASESFRVGGEVDLHAGLVKNPSGANVTSSGHLFAQQILPSGWGMTLGAGAGLIAGVGAPDYRVLAGLHYGAAPADADKDGLVGDEDSCPSLPEDIDGFEDLDGCPDVDNDGDGVVDADDRCPGVAEDLDQYEDYDGCPDEDNDQDGVADVDDLCPDVRGDSEGCPDTDGDGVPDGRDDCPNEPKPLEERVQLSDGCPKGVYFTDFTIAHDAPILFDGRGAEIDPGSHHVLDAVIGMLLEHPEITKLEVQAHIDDSGSERGDDAVTRLRATAVVDYLVAGGLAAERLTTRGMGHSEPVDTNRTETGRLRNRRTVFRIVTVDRSLIGTSPTRPEAEGTDGTWTPTDPEPPNLFDLPEDEGVDLEELWAPTRPERKPIVDIDEDEPEPEPKTPEGKRPPRSSKKR